MTKGKLSVLFSTLCWLLSLACWSPAQSLIVALKLGPDQIGVVKTAQGLTTRLTFPEPVKEVVCGDLYDAASGKGTFVVQRSENDVFIKPITTKGASNLFVKTGDQTRHIYNFDLSVVTFATAYRVVNVTSDNPQPTPQASPDNRSDMQDEALIAQAKAQAEDILRSARQQATRVVAEANASVDEMERRAVVDAAAQAQHRFVQALLVGINQIKLNNAHVITPKKVLIKLDHDMYVFDDKSYLRYTIQNNGDENFIFTGLALETGTGEDQKAIEASVVQNKVENKVAPGETVAGVIIFDQKQLSPKQKLTMAIRGDNNTTLTHIVVLQ